MSLAFVIAPAVEPSSVGKEEVKGWVNTLMLQQDFDQESFDMEGDFIATVARNVDLGVGGLGPPSARSGGSVGAVGTPSLVPFIVFIGGRSYVGTTHSTSLSMGI
jgi:hypothetical protein